MMMIIQPQLVLLFFARDMNMGKKGRKVVEDKECSVCVHLKRGYPDERAFVDSGYTLARSLSVSCWSLAHSA